MSYLGLKLTLNKRYLSLHGPDLFKSQRLSMSRCGLNGPSYSLNELSQFDFVAHKEPPQTQGAMYVIVSQKYLSLREPNLILQRLISTPKDYLRLKELTWSQRAIIVSKHYRSLEVLS